MKTDPEDKFFTNHHGGDGRTFLGNLRNLKVYGPSGTDWFSEGAKWTYRWNVLEEFGYEEIIISGDTIVNDQPCKVLQPMIVTSQDPFATADTIYRDPFYLYGSNDSIFYFFSSDFFSLYNFNMLPGDSIDYPALVSDPIHSCPPVTFILDSIASVDVDGVSLRQQFGRIRIDQLLDEDYIYIITEGIGFTHRIKRGAGNTQEPFKFGHLIPENAFTCSTDADSWMFCSYQSDQIAFNPGNEDCKEDLILPTQEVEVDYIAISPNPSNGWIDVESGMLQVDNVNIYSSSGQLLLQTSSAENRIQLPNRHGIYFIQIFTDGGIKVFKVVRN